MPELESPKDQEGQKTGDAQGSQDQNDGEGLASLKLTPEQQAQFDSALSKRLEREREKWSKEVDDAKAKAKKESDEARLAEQQQFQELANRRQETIQELTDQTDSLKSEAAKVKRYEKALSAYRDQMIEAHPDSIKVLLKSMDVVDQLEWLAENQPDGTKPKGYVGPPPAPGAKGDGKMTPEQRRQQSYRPKL